jgi:hypothetical protein
MRTLFMPSLPCVLASVLAAIVAPVSGFAATLTWPGSPGCTGTLQACVDAAIDNDRIEIATNVPITEGVAMHARSLTLTAAEGYTPVFQGVGVLANNSGSDGDMTVRISRLRFENGYVYATYAGSGTAVFDLRQLVLTRAPGATGNGIQVIAYEGTVEATLYDNRVSGQPLSLNSALIQLAASGGTLDASAYYNHVTSTASTAVSGAGIQVDVTQGGTGTIKMHANTVRGGFYRGGIHVSEGLLSSTPSSFNARLYSNVVVGSGYDGGNGISFTTNNGSIDVQAVNNTVTRCYLGLSMLRWDGGAGSTISGSVKNNLLLGHMALTFIADLTSGVDNDYNLLNGGTSGFKQGANTITTPALLASETQPRLTAASPAVEAADSATLGLGILFNALPTTDADGLRRFKRMTSGSKADIGAYEYGDISLAHHTLPNAGSHMSTINEPALDGRPDVNLFATPNFNGSDAFAIGFDRPYGFWYPAPHWSIHDQDNSVDMVSGAMLNLFVPAAGANNFRHTTTAESVSGFSSLIDNVDLTNHPETIVLVAQNWSAGDNYNPHPVGVYSFGWGGDSQWSVANLDHADMPLGTGFSIYYQQPSPNAFRVTMPIAGQSLTIDHPLLNGTPCARLIATRMWAGELVSGHFDVAYNAGPERWTLYSYAPMPAGTQFNVLVDPAQVAACANDVIFANGFE